MHTTPRTPFAGHPTAANNLPQIGANHRLLTPRVYAGEHLFTHPLSHQFTNCNCSLNTQTSPTSRASRNSTEAADPKISCFSHFSRISHSEAAKVCAQNPEYPINPLNPVSGKNMFSGKSIRSIIAPIRRRKCAASAPSLVAPQLKRRRIAIRPEHQLVGLLPCPSSRFRCSAVWLFLSPQPQRLVVVHHKLC